jgi:hypothetical protein
MIETVPSGLLAPVEGLVTVELADADTGRVRYRETSENFLSQQSLRVAKWWQRAMWMWFNPNESSDLNANKPTAMPWWPAQHIAYWNDATAEDAANEDRIRSQIVGWASRHPVGSPTGKRGVVNITESLATETNSKWVFDWGTSQGNGTFQSVGWTRIDEGTGTPMIRYPEDDILSFTANGTFSGTGAFMWDAPTSAWLAIESVGSNQSKIASYPAAGGTSTLVVTLPASIWGYNGSTGLPDGLAKLGTDYIIAGHTSSNFSMVARHTSAGAITWQKTGTVNTAGFRDVTIDGSSNIWVACIDGAMRRLSSADGSILATVTPTGITSMTSITYDPADGNFWIDGSGANHRGYLKVDSSGNIVGYPMGNYQTDQSVNSTAPFTGTYLVQKAASRENIGVALYTSGGTVTIQRIGTGASGTCLSIKDGTLYTVALVAAGGGLSKLSPVRGGNLGSRTRLSSPVTKTASQTLKITYQFNFA